jgi:hypothetical protein
MFLTNVAEKIKTNTLCTITFFLKPCRLWDNLEKYGTAGQATDDNTIRRMRVACCITKARDKHAEYVTLIVFPGNNGYANAPQFYVYTYIACLIKSNLEFLYKYLSSIRHVSVNVVAVKHLTVSRTQADPSFRTALKMDAENKAF